MSRLPVRVRLALVFAAAMALVLVAVGTLLYVRLGESLAEELDESLTLRAATLRPAVASAAVQDDELAAGDDDGFGQVFDARGTLVASTPALRGERLVEAGALRRARSGAFFLSLDGVPELDGEPARLLVSPAGERVLVVGASLEDREDALAGLVRELLVVGPVALLLSSLAGYLLAGAALRPVDAMRRRADEISGESPGARLPLSPARDELRRLGETLNAMLGRLEIARARERRFVADASHELRTPLALLRAELELALRRERSPEELERALRSAAEEVERLARLAEDLLVLARADEGGLPLRREGLSSRELLTAVARRFAARASGAGRALEIAPGDIELVGDRLRLEQAVGNLVDNALRHGAGVVRLAAVWRNGSVEFRVSDEGRGFPPEFLPHAFERFTRADDARTNGATGLGLAIADAIARAHGGSTSAENGAGRGSVVTLRVPA